MDQLNFVVLYVDDLQKSTAFYADLLGAKFEQLSPVFTRLVMKSSLIFGLKTKPSVVPPATPPGGSEIGFVLGDAKAVDAAHDDWRHRGIRIIQAPIDEPFAHTFVAVDPDGHRIRVTAPKA
jgi:predicted enzyme related to lactoylglutathione lyase